ncbi:hypothetical protein MTO96_015158 [Rhipicephalus appendiculatus]
MMRKSSQLSYEALSWTAIAIAVVYVLFKLVRSRQKTFSYFKEIGIPGPEPSLIWGNLAEYQKKGFVHSVTEWGAKYGDVFGFYNGDLPMLVVKDLDFITYVFINDFKNFTDRGMMPELVESADLFVETLGHVADAGRELAIHEPLQALAMDFVGRAAFGFDCYFQRNPSHPFMQAAHEVIRGVMTGPFHMIAHCTSTLADFVSPMLWLNAKFGSFTFSIFGEEAKRVVEMRLRNPEARRPDLLQVMLDASEKKECLKDADSKSKASMTLQEVQLNTTVTLIAGFETTSAAMAYVSYVLAKYRDVQEKVRAEVASAVEEYVSA